MAGSKRAYDVDDPPRPPKRARLHPAAGPDEPPAPSALAAADRLSRLSDELLVRILDPLPVAHLLAVARVSRRFCRLAADGQLWRALYRQRFAAAAAAAVAAGGPGIDWKRAYRLRLNWARGTCAVATLRLGEDDDVDNDADSDDDHHLAQIADGLAVTADARHGLRVWALATRSLLAHAPLSASSSDRPVPTALAVHSTAAPPHGLDIAVGLRDGGFCAWRLDRAGPTLTCRATHTAGAAAAAAPLVAIAYAHPYVLTATDGVVVSLYAVGDSERDAAAAETGPPPPTLLTALAAPTARPPLALAVRTASARRAVASLAYTVVSRQGWALGVQDLHIAATAAAAGAADRSRQPAVVASRLSFTLPVDGGRRRRAFIDNEDVYDDGDAVEEEEDEDDDTAAAPTALAYAHPYLLATLPDNTLVLHRCGARTTAGSTAVPPSLALGPGVRLWGHTAGIAGAAVAARGRAVSVSRGGDELRVWDLEGRPPAVAEPGRSVVIRATGRGKDGDDDNNDDDDDNDRTGQQACVGLDEEHVVVLRDAHSRRARLMVYDFS